MAMIIIILIYHLQAESVFLIKIYYGLMGNPGSGS